MFDKGNMKDGEGRDIDFKNTVIIMTSNAGTDLINKLFADPETAPDAAGLAEALRPELAKVFKPAFLGRVTLVPYFPLPNAIIRQIVTMQLERIRNRVRDSYRATFDWTPELVDMIAARCTESSSGARNVENILTRTLLARAVRRGARAIGRWRVDPKRVMPASTRMGCYSSPLTNRKGVDSFPSAFSTEVDSANLHEIRRRQR